MRRWCEAWPRLSGRVAFVAASLDEVADPSHRHRRVEPCLRRPDRPGARASRPPRARVAVLPCCHDLAPAMRASSPDGSMAPSPSTSCGRCGSEQSGYRIWTQAIPAEHHAEEPPADWGARARRGDLNRLAAVGWNCAGRVPFERTWPRKHENTKTIKVVGILTRWRCVRARSCGRDHKLTKRRRGASPEHEAPKHRLAPWGSNAIGSPNGRNGSLIVCDWALAGSITVELEAARAGLRVDQKPVGVSLIGAVTTRRWPAAGGGRLPGRAR